MPLRFRKASCVVAGTFNMYILHPHWLGKHRIIKSGTEVGIETNLARPGFRFHFPDIHAVWSVAPDRIVVETDAWDTNCGDVVAKVLTALPETPLIALGNNSVYKAGRDELATLIPAIRDFPQPKTSSGGEVVVQKAFHFSVKRSDHEVVNLQLSLAEDAIELSCNAHTKLDGCEEADQAAIATAERFFQDREMSEELARQFFGVTICHVADND